MQYYALKYKYLHTTSNKGNLGDNIQTIPVLVMLKKLGVEDKDIDLVNRDDLSIEHPGRKRGILIAQGWFGCTPGHRPLPVNDTNIHPLYFGFHVNEGSWQILGKNAKFISSLKKYEPIGCRDLGTRDFLRSLKIKSYFSRCLTMTFDKRKNHIKNGKLFLIDVNKKIEKYIPLRFKKNIVKLSQEDYSSSSYSPSGEWPMNDEDVEIVDKEACKRIELLKREASLVVTSRIHAAMPCAAMGIPVIFCYPNKHDARVSVVQELFPVYEPENFKNIDWEIESPKMEDLKTEIQLMFTYRLQVEEHKMGMQVKRLSDADYSKAEKLVEQACVTSRHSITYTVKSFLKADVLESVLGRQKETVLKNNTPIVLFGAGSAGSHLCSILKYYGVIPVCFCDNKIKVDNQFFCKELPIISFKTLKERHRNSLILISVKYYLEEIKKQLSENNFSDNQIIESTSFIEQYIDFVVPEDKRDS